ncbi:MAG: hypothetical protein ACRYGR_08135 [Janthinobacterium lividum]
MELLIADNSVPLASADSMPTSGTPQYATAGNSGVTPPVAPTRIPASHYNMMMAELLNAVVAAGLTPSGTDWTQLTQAIKALARKQAGVIYEYSGAYNLLPSPLIIQAFTSPSVQLGAANTEVSYYATFPVAFPNGLISISAVDHANASINWNSFQGSTVNGTTGYAWSPFAGTQGTLASSTITALGW